RVLDGLGVPWTDPFSYVAAGRPWIAYSWLPETIFAFVERAWGLPALVVLAAALAAATTVVVWRTCVATGARPAVALGAALAAMLLSAPAWNVRPHLVSFLCLALTNHVLVLARRGRDRTWWLVPVMLLWANSHILFPLGLVLVAIHAGAEAWAPRVGGARLSRRPAAVGTALVATTLATPYGWHLWRHVVVMMCQPVAFSMVTEFQTPSLHAASGLLLTAAFFATVLTLIATPARKDPADVASVFAFGFLAYAMERNVPFFAIVMAPVLARHADALLPARRAPAPRGAAPAAGPALLVAAGLAALAARTAALLGPDAAVDGSRLPVAAVRFLATREPGRLLNHFDWGGYLIDRLWPRWQVAMDGRTQVYGEETLRAYRAMVFLEPGWRAFLDRTRPDVVLWPKRTAFAHVVELLPEWQRVWED